MAGSECDVAAIEASASGVEDGVSHVLEEIKGLGGLDGGLRFRGTIGGERPGDRKEEHKLAESDHCGSNDASLSFPTFCSGSSWLNSCLVRLLSGDMTCFPELRGPLL